MKIRAFLTLAFTIFVFCTLTSSSAAAQDVSGLVITVGSNADAHDAALGDGVCADTQGRCTLRAAVEEANSSIPADAVIFDLPQPAVIDLTLGELVVSRALDIVGPGARRLTVRRSLAAGTSTFRIFHIMAGQVVFNMRGLTITNGNDLFGGGILIDNGGIVGLIDSSISGNHGQLGGALMSTGRVTVLRCLFDSNTATTQVGAIVNSGGAADLTIIGSTITRNSAPATGAIYNEGTVLLVNDTISGNVATQGVSGIFSGPQGTIKVLNTIIGPDAAGTVQTINGPFQSAGNNIVTDARGSTGFTNAVNGDQVSDNNVINPLLGPLADNGGQTDTMSLLTNSPAIKGGNVCATNNQCALLPGTNFRGRYDQRHLVRRFFEANIDVGAFESNALATIGAGSLGLLAGPTALRFAGSPASAINPTTLERRYALVRINGSINFTNLPTIDVYVIEVRSKRKGFATPLVFGLD